MASLIKKLKKGIPYYYVVECKRINGKPRIVEQHYLGTAEKIFKTCQRKSAPAAKGLLKKQLGLIMPQFHNSTEVAFCLLLN